MSKDFNNGDKVIYAGGPHYLFVGYNPLNESQAYCIRVDSYDGETVTNTNEWGDYITNCLPINRLEKA